MRRTTALLASLPFALALSACGGGGGSNDAFCAAAEEIEGEDDPSLEEVEELADAAPDELDDQFELLIEFLEAIEDGDTDALEDFDEDDVEDAVADIEEFAEDECGIELDDEDGDDDASTTTTEAPDEDDDSDDGDAAGDLPDAASPPDLDDPTEALLAEDCEDGDLAACDQLFGITDIGSDGETYGATCGGRVDEDEAQPGECTELFGQADGSGDVELGDPSTPPDLDDPEEAALAEACFEGDLGSCDQLFRVTDVGSVGETYGATCGGRVEESDNLRNQCEATFG